MKVLTRLATLSVILCFSLSAAANSSRQRMVVLTDIEADPDDAQTLVRLLLYSNQIDIEGIIATTSVHQKSMVAPESIHQVIDAYAKVQKNLSRHERGYPSAKSLRALVKPGLPVYGMNGVGEGKNSEASNWLLAAIEKDDPRPLWITVWGGPNVLAQALFQLQQNKTEAELEPLIKKLRVYTISDQDDSAFWIRNNFPELFYIVSPGGYGAATWTGINQVVDGIDNATISTQWLADNIQQNHGPLGVQYPDVAYGMEGDTPSWLNLIDNGLSVPEKPNWGGWGGRYELYVPEQKNTDPNGFTGGVPVPQEKRPIWTNAIDRYVREEYSPYGRSIRRTDKVFEGYRTSLWRWRDDFQNDFAARMDWTVKPYAKANHPPIPVLKHSDTIQVIAGHSFYLDARGSHDPDGDALQYWWFNYPEPGSMPTQEAPVDSAENMARVHVIAPKVQKPQQLHYILQLRDRGEPPLTRYKRVIVNVQPK
jgi:hypothetical protein